MGGDCEARAIGSSRSLADDVPFRIYPYALETKLRKSLRRVSDARGFLEWWSRDFADAYQLIGKLVGDPVNEVKRVLHPRIEQ
jgi:hypothetical protein